MIEVPPDVSRVALAGDWHGETPYARKAIARAHKAGAEGIVHLGDFGLWPGSAGLRYLNSVQHQCAMRGMWLLMVDGNHDDHWQLRDKPIQPSGVRQLTQNIAHLPRGLRWEWQGRSWVALGGAISLDRRSRRIGTSWWPEEAISVTQAEKVAADGPVDVMVTHDIASGVAVPGLHDNWPYDALSDAIAHRRLLRGVADVVQPTHWGHGHMHVSYTDKVLFGERQCRVRGLNCNGAPLQENLAIVDTRTLDEIPW